MAKYGQKRRPRPSQTGFTADLLNEDTRAKNGSLLEHWSSGAGSAVGPIDVSCSEIGRADLQPLSMNGLFLDRVPILRSKQDFP
jgi:hypothetical protein